MYARRSVLLAALAALAVPVVSTFGQPYDIGTAFTYQGRLEFDDSAVTDTCDFEFSLWEDDETPPGSQVGSTVPKVVAVTDGLFTAELDFGEEYNGEARWLEMAVCCPTGCAPGSLETLSPRHELTPAPYAVFASHGNTLDEAYDEGGAGAGRTVTADTGAVEILGPDGLIVAGTIQSGSSITIDGTTKIIDCSDTVELHVGGERALRLELVHAVPNVIGGADNTVEAYVGGATIAGGGGGLANGTYRCNDVTLQPCGFCEGGTYDGAMCSSHVVCTGGTCEPDDTECVSPAVCVFYEYLRCYGGPNNGLVCGECAGGSNPGATCAWDDHCNGGTCEPDDIQCTDPGVCATATPANRVTGWHGTIGGGSGNIAAGNATVGGGQGNMALGYFSTIGGGDNNFVGTYGFNGTIGGGSGNVIGLIGEGWATIAGGKSNSATNMGSIGGGMANTASGPYATVGGGIGNSASANGSTVPGGTNNVAGGAYSFAAGSQAKVRTADDVGGGDWDGDEGTFVWADSSFINFTSTGPDRFLVRAGGGSYFYTSSDLSTGSHLAAGSGTWASVSDREVKENLASVNGREVLRKLDGIPVTTWNYKTEDPSIRHMGPMAQDLHAAFGLGDSEKSIGTIDADGVALAAIQGLHEIVEEKDAQIANQQEQLAELAARLAALEKLMKLAITGQEGGVR